MASAIEDAGFEIRDSIHWLYSSGFPKSHDVSKGIDKLDATAEQKQRRYRFTAWVRSTGLTAKQIDEATGTEMGSHYTTHPTQPAVMTREHLEKVRHLIGKVPEWVEHETAIRSVESRNFASREVVGEREVPIGHAFAGPIYGGDSSLKTVNITAPATDAAKQWAGWGTALKPAHEPIVVARKPLVGTVAANVQQHGTGALNIDGARVGDRWPANVITDGSIDAEWVRYFFCPKASKAERNAGLDALPATFAPTMNNGIGGKEHDPITATPKQNTHPTVKPLALMRYLVRLVTPPGGTVLEPFAGSGTTLAAAILEGFDAIGCELTDDYLPIIEGRIAWAQQERAKAHDSLFGENE
jgi:site-specific DNA-methyltransferase (adenine-specific)